MACERAVFYLVRVVVMMVVGGWGGGGGAPHPQAETAVEV